MKTGEFAYVGNPIPKINVREHKDFIMHFQKSALLSLVKRGLLTQAQMNCVMVELEKQYNNIKS